MRRLPAREIASKLKKSRESGGSWQACCPAHNDKNPSLSLKDSADGSVLFFCHAGCTQEAVIEALIDLGLWDTGERTVSVRAAPKIEWRPVMPVPAGTPDPDFAALCFREPDQIYIYRNAQGDVLGYICRLEQPAGAKLFWPVTHWLDDADRPVWQRRGFPEPRPLYGLYELAQRPEAPVLVVEGEKAADAARPLFPECVVVSWPNGAKAVANADWSPLKCRTVVIWPDNDGPGLEAANAVSEAADRAGARSVVTVSLPTALPNKWDLADLVPDGVNVQALFESAMSTDPTLARFVMSARQMRHLDIPQREYLIDPFLPGSGLVMLFAKRGLGKSWWALTMALALARGEDFLGYRVPRSRRVLFIDGEMALADLKERLRLLGGPETEELLFLSSETLAQNQISININSPEDQSGIDAALVRLERNGTRPDLIVLDNLSSLGRGLDENDNSALDGQLAWLVSLRHRGYAVMMVHHAGKSGEQRGASRREDLLDTVIKLEAPAEDNASGKAGATAELEFTKTRGIAPNPSKLRLELRKGPAGNLEWFYGRSVTIKPRHKTLRTIYEGCKELGGARPFRDQTELGGAVELSKGAVSQHMTALVAEGLVWRDRGALLATPKGVEKLQLLFGTLPEPCTQDVDPRVV